MRFNRGPAVGLAALLAGALVLSGCGSDDEETDGGTNGGGEIPEIDATAFTADFSEMEKLQDVAAQGDGLIQVLLPDTTTSTKVETWLSREGSTPRMRDPKVRSWRLTSAAAVTAKRHSSSASFWSRVASRSNSRVTRKFSVPPNRRFCVFAICTTSTACCWH